MTESALEILVELFAFFALVVFIVSLSYQGFSISWQRNGYSRRNSKQEVAIMRARLEHLLRRE